MNTDKAARFPPGAASTLPPFFDMAPWGMDIYINPEKSPAAVQAKATGSPISSLRLKRGATISLSVVILGSSAASNLRFGLKAKGDYEGALLAYAQANNGVTTDEGTRFELSLHVASEALNDALAVGSGIASSAATLPAVAEFAWREDGAERLSDTINTTLLNDIIRLASEAPEAAAGEYPAPDLVATKPWVNNKQATAEAAGFVMLGTDDTVSGKHVRPVGKAGDGGLAVDASGLSAYEIAVSNGFVGTETAWLASLKGERGAKGEQGEPADIGQTVDAAIERIMTPSFEPLAHDTAFGEGGNLYFNWFELAAGHIVEGRLVSLSIPCRTSANDSIGREALCLSVWQQDAFGSWARLGCSSNSVTQHVGQTGIWQFDRIPVRAQALRFCAQSGPEEGWSTAHVLGGRSLASDDGSTITYSNTLRHVLLGTLVFAVPQTRFVMSSAFEALARRVEALEERASLNN